MDRPIKIYLDDVRDTPIGYLRTYTVDETIELIKKYNGIIDTVSLDNDLGENITEGYKVMDWLEEMAFNNNIEYIPNVLVHSSNTCRVTYMSQASLKI